MLGALLTPSTEIAPPMRVLVWVAALVWVIMELLPEIGFLLPNQFLMGLITLPVLFIAFTAMRQLQEHYPGAVVRLITLTFLGEIAYVLPYLLAIPVERRPPFAGIGCMSIGCGSALSGADSTTFVYAIGSHFAGSFSVVLVILVAVFGKRLMMRVISCTRKT